MNLTKGSRTPFITKNTTIRKFSKTVLRPIFYVFRPISDVTMTYFWRISDQFQCFSDLFLTTLRPNFEIFPIYFNVFETYSWRFFLDHFDGFFMIQWFPIDQFPTIQWFPIDGFPMIPWKSELSHRWTFYDQRKSGNESSMTHRWTFYEISMIHRWGSLGTREPGNIYQMLPTQLKWRGRLKLFEFIFREVTWQTVSKLTFPFDVIFYWKDVYVK